MHPKNIEIRLCLPEEITGVITLNANWQKKALGDNLIHGFVAGDSNLDYNYLKEAVKRKEIVVALDNTSVIGYSMANTIEHSPLNHSKINEMVEKGFLSSEVKVALAIQTAVNLSYQSQGIARALICKLASHIKSHYDIMATSVSKQNINSLKVHENRNGWKVYDQDDEHIFVFYDLHQREPDSKYFQEMPNFSQ